MWGNQSRRFTHALTCKDNETNKHSAVHLLIVPSDNQKTEAIAMPNQRWLVQAVALLTQSHATPKSKWMNVLVLHRTFGCYQKVTPAFDDISRAAKMMGRSWKWRRVEEQKESTAGEIPAHIDAPNAVIRDTSRMGWSFLPPASCHANRPSFQKNQNALSRLLNRHI